MVRLGDSSDSRRYVAFAGKLRGVDFTDRSNQKARVRYMLPQR